MSGLMSSQNLLVGTEPGTLFLRRCMAADSQPDHLTTQAVFNIFAKVAQAADV